jgi:arylsulfatase A-like enzyme
MTTPNILLITTDQHRWDYLGAMGQPALKGLTPNLDRLAAEGALFEHAYSPNPLCMPTRHAIQSGLYTFQSGQMTNVGDWPMNFPTYTQALQRRGYHTALTGKLHAHEAVGYDIDLTDAVWDDEIHALGFDDVLQVAGKTMAFFTEDAYTHHLEKQGLLHAYREDVVRRREAAQAGKPNWWPSILPEEDYVDAFIGARAAAWFDAYDGDRPFFHMVSFCSPHPSFDAPQRALAGIDPAKIQLPAHVEDGESLRGKLANYAAQIHVVDEQIGRVLSALEARGWLDETLILFTADHGERLGDAGLWGKCGWQDGSVRVPLIARLPRSNRTARRGRRATRTMASCHDVTATILDFAADQAIIQDVLPGCSSISMRPFLEGRAPGVRDLIYSENGGQFGRPWRMVDDGSYRYVWLLDTGEELLFDRRTDPHCRQNLAAMEASQSMLGELRRAMLRIHVTHPTPKTGRAAHSPQTTHTITRERLKHGKTES